MANADNAIMTFLPGSKPTFSTLWNGKWKLDVDDNVIPDIREVPTSPNSTNKQGVGKWLGKGYKLPEDVPTKDDGSYRMPPGTKENLLQEKKEQEEFAKAQIERYTNKKQEASPDQSELLLKIADTLGNVAKRLEALENGGINKKDDRPNPSASKAGSKSKPKGNNKKGAATNRKRGNKSGAGSGQKTG